jgi:hypothetical protein
MSKGKQTNSACKRGKCQFYCTNGRKGDYCRLMHCLIDDVGNFCVLADVTIDKIRLTCANYRANDFCVADKEHIKQCTITKVRDLERDFPGYQPIAQP